MRVLAAFLVPFALLSLVVKLDEMSAWFALSSAAFFAVDTIAARLTKHSETANISRVTVL